MGAADKRRSTIMKSLEEQVSEIADREEIKELTAKYAHWVALGEGAKVAQLFTDDGAFINEVMGKSQISTCMGAGALTNWNTTIGRLCDGKSSKLVFERGSSFLPMRSPAKIRAETVA